MRWTVGMKIGMGFALALLILLIIGTVAYQSTGQMVDTAEWVDHTHLVLEDLNGVMQTLTAAETTQRGYLLTGKDEYLTLHRALLAPVSLSASGHRTGFDPTLGELIKLTSDNAVEQQRLDKLQPLIAQRLASLKEGIDTRTAKGAEGAQAWAMLGKGKAEMDEIRVLVEAMQNTERDLLNKRSLEAKQSAATTKLTITLGTVAAFLILLVASWLITRNISVPLRRLTGLAEKIAIGDLTVAVATDHRQDEVGVLSHTFGKMTGSLREMADVATKIAGGDLKVHVKPQSEKDVLGNAFASMIENLQRLTSQMAEGINVLSTSANQISTSTTQLAGSASETATAVSQATATVEEVRQTAQLSSQKSKLVSESAQRMSAISQTGMKSTEETAGGINRIRQQMDSIAQTMARLSEQSQTIGQIVSTVEDLAAQSNLLAVNAAIEAAKAGEHGKGFGVVAQEVRSLAEQSKQATTQVRSILNDIQKATSAAAMATEQGSKAVEAGVQQVGVAGEAIQSLSNSVAEGAQAATQIAASSQQQLIGVDQVASAMESIKQASTQNVASAQQLEAAAHNLKDLGMRLKQLVQHYKV